MAIFGILILLFTACKKEEEPKINPPVSNTPEIKIEKINPLTVNQFESITFEISYIDGDGDIGTEDADVISLEILDLRDNILHTFHVPPQSPVSGVTISGVLVVEVKNLILLDQSNDSEDVIFNVRLKDREENWSETETSQTITVIK